VSVGVSVGVNERGSLWKRSVSVGDNIFQPQKSTLYFYYLIFTHLFAFISVCTIAPLFFDFIFFGILIILFLYHSFRDEKIISFQYAEKTKWILTLNDKTKVEAELLSSSVMMRHFLVLHFKLSNSADKKRMVIFSDHFSRKNFKAFRRCVKIGFL
jgi:hypothetical protein